ncbi:MAG: GNAT family N-acetyltransferase [Flavobacteriales bacterium]|nr:GNAT family N-acetyltransferase [Flavobacteriia bacterium]NCP06525.1 GNAT family N-acetyltransferase [Flavobacteriales bacterium]PIV93865.1 MAG: GNAT family N-acetyltransferase [Flavobacteriaceae bacterium CG17_big_fil_post_rev_8_21_14_2_50_33_15]PIY09368.1 MAG: GNAT family N-acetyltransferase [Flavobacteriaceae bacterium CG_4_10_14_3_um_filter_33_47]PJB17664.1 MAG: GNAT family N-acetyltransferase [Flavobacteriaceae bacterium CG_4_9_14_3_um_filter_33_16]
MLKILVKAFNELTTQELYDILQLRSEVFVVEQNCVYQDIDGKDQKALHILGFKNNQLVAYTRIFKPGDYFENASIGRVVVAKNQRQHQYGYDIMKVSIEAVENHFKETLIKISAQAYLKGFYNNLGFNEIGEEYLEDDIPHIAMIKT